MYIKNGKAIGSLHAKIGFCVCENYDIAKPAMVASLINKPKAIDLRLKKKTPPVG